MAMEFEGMRILVADDEPQMQDLLLMYLTNLGFEVRTVGDGQEALEALAAEHFDAAVVDVSMPRIDGIELVRRTRSEHPRVGFVVITGYPSKQAILDSANAGAVRFLAKPFELADLRAAVVAALHADRGGLDLAETSVEVQARSQWVEITAGSRREHVERVEHLFELLSGHHLSPLELEDIKIVINEVVTNAVEWGNRHDLVKPVRISYCLFPGEIVFKVEDLGVGFEPGEVPDPLVDPEHGPAEVARRREADGKRPGGFGLAITRKVMDRVIYNRLGNSVVMSKRLGSGAD